MWEALAFIGSYILGSIPFGYIVGKVKGYDIRKEGSGNIGSTNVFRVIGKKEGIFVFILDLVRRRKLREEYSWLWLLTCLALFLMVMKYSWLEAISGLVGAVLPTTTLFIGALIFLMILCVQFSVVISRLTNQVEKLMQENALLRQKMEEIDSHR